MSRSRNIKPGFFKNEHLVSLPFETRLLFIGLWTMADREGLMEDRPLKIKLEIFPGDNVDVDKCLDQLNSVAFIERYQINNNKYIQILNFNKHQNPHHKEQASTLPAPDMPEASPVKGSTCPKHAVLIPDSLNLIPDSLPKERKDVVYPDWLDMDAWNEFVVFRKKARAPLTDRAITLAINKLKKLKAEGNNPTKVIEESILSGWKGLFPLKNEGSSYEKSKPLSAVERVEKANREKFGNEPIDGQSKLVD